MARFVHVSGFTEDVDPSLVPPVGVTSAEVVYGFVAGERRGVVT
ncbi:hypothetical protein BJY18_002026 [Amycolatopsis jiangsuensis]|uniref:Uncharacterized protein n=1 Tax=Amycolatopsis jiangsuensis TaxID=1181879 RepID=A0A840IS11_9PSEU|nr:hypothetical protein [Amycolatopsis jiangsuensis]MBB4684541.1 hypothetical protein [Amycolatopsis jiangsuensis]